MPASYGLTARFTPCIKDSVRVEIIYALRGFSTECLQIYDSFSDLRTWHDFCGMPPE